MADCVILTGMSAPGAIARTAGPYRIASELRRHGLETQVIDYVPRLGLEQLAAAVEKYVRPWTVMVGISSTFLGSAQIGPFEGTFRGLEWPPNLKTLYRKLTATCRFIRDNYPHVKLVLGGRPMNIFPKLEVDAVFRSYAEDDLLKYLGLPSDFDFQKSRITYHETDHVQPYECLPIEISRGCKFRCAFCSYPMNGRKGNDYIKHAETIEEEMLENHRKWGVTSYMLMDDTYNETPEKLERLYQAYARLPFKMQFASYLRHDLINAHRDTVETLVKSGLHAAVLGIETLNHQAGKAVGKGLHPDKTKEFLYWLKAKYPSIYLSSGFIVGLPHETKEDLFRTFNWTQEADCPITWPTWTAYGLHMGGSPSPIAMNPEVYGYTPTGDGWASKWMTYKEARELVGHFDRNRALKPGAAYSGFRGLGLKKMEQWYREQGAEVLVEAMIKRHINGYHERVLG